MNRDELHEIGAKAAYEEGGTKWADASGLMRNTYLRDAAAHNAAVEPLIRADQTEKVLEAVLLRLVFGGMFSKTAEAIVDNVRTHLPVAAEPPHCPNCALGDPPEECKHEHPVRSTTERGVFEYYCADCKALLGPSEPPTANPLSANVSIPSFTVTGTQPAHPFLSGMQVVQPPVAAVPMINDIGGELGCDDCGCVIKRSKWDEHIAWCNKVAQLIALEKGGK